MRLVRTAHNQNRAQINKKRKDQVQEEKEQGTTERLFLGDGFVCVCV